jgi:hypothetical protein
VDASDKSAIIETILATLREEFEARQRASKQARTGGNDAESKAESKYDTLSIEENYLADGLAKQALAAAQAAAAYEDLGPREFTPGEAIDIGALVEIEFPTGREWFFLGPAAGGIEIDQGGRSITVLTPESPLGSQLLGRRTGEATTAPKAKIRTVH